MVFGSLRSATGSSFRSLCDQPITKTDPSPQSPFSPSRPGAGADRRQSDVEVALHRWFNARKAPLLTNTLCIAKLNLVGNAKYSPLGIEGRSHLDSISEEGLADEISVD